MVVFGISAIQERGIHMTIDVQDAIKRSIQTEKNAMNFYLLGSQQMKDPDAKRTFALLA